MPPCGDGGFWSVSCVRCISFRSVVVVTVVKVVAGTAVPEVTAEFVTVVVVVICVEIPVEIAVIAVTAVDVPVKGISPETAVSCFPGFAGAVCAGAAVSAGRAAVCLWSKTSSGG